MRIFLFPYMGHSQTYDLEELNTAREKIYIPGDWNEGGVCVHGFEVIADRTKLAHAVFSRSLE
jgi:hypothetical protein